MVKQHEIALKRERIRVALTLLEASPNRARSAAIALHEQFCAAGDWVHAEFWEAVLEEMAARRSAQCSRRRAS
jgi:hypothetical protein